MDIVNDFHSILAQNTNFVNILKSLVKYPRGAGVLVKEDLS